MDKTQKEEVMEYMERTYSPLVERPWANGPEDITFKERETMKWFAIIIRVKRKHVQAIWNMSRNAANAQNLCNRNRFERNCENDEVMGVNAESGGTDWVDIINVKADAEFIAMIAQVRGYMAGYHMNKQNWLTIALDGTVETKQILDCIDASYHKVADTPTKRIYEAVKRIPKGCVATYGQVAAMAGNPRMSRAVGNALHKNPDPANIPCHRVVNAKGQLAEEFVFGGKNVQEERLLAENVCVTNGCVDLKKYGIIIENEIK